MSDLNMGATLLVMDDDKRIIPYDLTKRNKWSFGRQTQSNHPDIPVKSGIVSRDHGEFVSMDGQWFYLDHGGKNGTFLNGEKVSCGNGKRRYPVLLSDGDMLRVDYSDLSNPDGRGVFLLFSERRITDTKEAEELFRCNLR